VDDSDEVRFPAFEHGKRRKTGEVATDCKRARSVRVECSPAPTVKKQVLIPLLGREDRKLQLSGLITTVAMKEEIVTYNNLHQDA
jgi:hypothetical protein